MDYFRNLTIGKVRLSSPLCLAPLLGINCTAFRLMCHNNGAALVYSPMIDAECLVKKSREWDVMVDFIKEEMPVAAQLVGNDPGMMADAARMLEDYVDIIDINFGCCEGIPLGQKKGAYFMKHPEGIPKIVSRVASATNLPVTAKIRSGWDSKSINAVEVAKIIEDAGAEAIAVHPRTRKQNYTGKADWKIIRAVKENISIPVIGNGDVTKPEHAKAMLDQTKCRFVMIGRGAIGNPYIFRQCFELLKNNKRLPDMGTKEKGKLILDFIKLYDKVQKIKRFSELKQHAMWFCTGARAASSKRQAIMKAESKAGLLQAVKKEFIISAKPL